LCAHAERVMRSEALLAKCDLTCGLFYAFLRRVLSLCSTYTWIRPLSSHHPHTKKGERESPLCRNENFSLSLSQRQRQSLEMHFSNFSLSGKVLICRARWMQVARADAKRGKWLSTFFWKHQQQANRLSLRLSKGERAITQPAACAHTDTLCVRKGALWGWKCFLKALKHGDFGCLRQRQRATERARADSFYIFVNLAGPAQGDECSF
jgi:hypothetical protein